MNPNKLLTVVVFVLLGAGLGASGWLVSNPVQRWPTFDGPDKAATEVGAA